ncbi:hypothetical protein TVAG_088800 [Trichomonas vaginalis G3]|uniref:Uncharacterized protein n=1 Tax=Trichomonas vaginalis (strain ATCC PRA-98 / G3) TaxID=412133 RepID=A2EB25_TRIV3|nr:armadillo (ARM) repeat-containing protein family [Trichomonas vaginalis G3]EAY10165.1 hypothetical protein TVAG_088800 [Trichomonas vaginalis G3]KAI5534460.1 armadillo (ARM) repeat-containing protein family [Trichomonas vaginalis G3]|eukprot:XP_001322388.1 hypothetical protein [Trichomonas vaginalis G3]
MKFIDFLSEEYVFKPQTKNEYVSDFMENFFTKSPMETCPGVFIDILVMLAALDYEGFVQQLLPNALQRTDIVHNLTLHALCHIFTPVFIERAKYTEAQLERIRAISHSFVIHDLSGLEKIPMAGYDPFLNTLTSRSTDEDVELFITKNRLTFEPHLSQVNKLCTFGPQYTSKLALAQVTSSILKFDDANDKILAKSLLTLLSCSDALIHLAAQTSIAKIFKKNDAVLIQHCFDNIFNGSPELRRNSLDTILLVIKNGTISTELAQKITILCIVLLSSSLRDIRIISTTIIKHIAKNCDFQLIKLFSDRKEFIEEEVISFLRISNVSDTTSNIKTIIDVPDWETVASSNYDSIWRYYFSTLMTIIIETKPEMLEQIRSTGLTISKAAFTPESTGNAVTYLSMMVSTFAGEDGDSNSVIESCVEYINTIVRSRNSTHITHLLQAMHLMNYKVLPSMFTIITQLDPQFYPEITAALRKVIQNPSFFTNIFLIVFNTIVQFLASLQKYFFSNKMCSPTEMRWDAKAIETVKVKNEMCINYCTIVSAVFNNISGKVTEDEWPLPSRQLMTRILIQWVNIPGNFENLHEHAINALVPVLCAGTIFTNGFEFDPSLMCKLIDIQAEGYLILNFLLTFHVDILMTEFIISAFIEPPHTAQMFQDAIIQAIDYCMNSTALVMHIGPMVLFANSIFDTNYEGSITIFTKLADVFISEKSTVIIQESHDDTSFIYTLFDFATENVIKFGLNILKERANRKLPLKKLVSILVPWFSKIKLLPTNSSISNVDPFYRIYNVLSFIDEMCLTSNVFDEEQLLLFAEIWDKIMSNRENSKIVMISLYNNESEEVKAKIFKLLCNKHSDVVCKFLAKRCRFSYWYFCMIHNLSIERIFWSLPILQLCFQNHIENAAPYFTTVLHFSILFYHVAKGLFDTLIGIAGEDVGIQVEQILCTSSMDQSKTIHGIVSEVAKKLRSNHSETAVETWTNEAMIWATCCRSLKHATRAMVILSSLEGQLDISFMTLLKTSVTFHLCATPFDNYSNFGNYMEAIYAILSNNVEFPQCSQFCFEFAIRFISIAPFARRINKNALPIFMKYFSKNPVAITDHPDVIVVAFLPFLSDLETNSENYEILENCITTFESNELLRIKTIYDRSIKQTKEIEEIYKQLLDEVNLTTQAEKLLDFYGIMLEDSSDDFATSIISGSIDLLKKFKDSLIPDHIQTICRCCLKRVYSVPLSVEFISLVSEFKFNIVSLESEIEADIDSNWADYVVAGLDSLHTPPTERVLASMYAIITISYRNGSPKR